MFFNYDTIKVYSIVEMNQMIAEGVTKINGGSLLGPRMQTMLLKGPKCIACKRTGTFYALQRAWRDNQTRAYHFNLWSSFYTKNGLQQFMLMTRDHIIPASKGGSDSLENSQCMCFTCNKVKAATMPEGIVMKPQGSKFIPY